MRSTKAAFDPKKFLAKVGGGKTILYYRNTKLFFHKERSRTQFFTSAVASTSRKRTAYLPPVPTVQESGIKDFEVVSWNGISVPAATPKAVVEVLTRGHQRGLAEPRCPGEGKQAGHGDARQHTGGDDGAHEKRHRQMGGGNREGRHSEA